MSHIHRLQNGSETGIEQVSSKDSEFHNHTTVDGKITSSEKFGIEHIHIIDDQETSGPIEIRSNEMNIETKVFGGHVTEVKQEERNGVPVGLISGHIATYDVDRGRDRFEKGAFLESLQEHQEKRRQIRFKDHHGRTVGGFPIETVREDEKGLFGIAEVNLEVQQGREAYSLAKQGVLSDFSIGYSSLDDEYVDGVRVIKKAIIWEGSIVDEPMNPKANVMEVKSVITFQDLPLSGRDREWDAESAINRVKEFTDSDESPSEAYRKAFLWYDKEDSESFGAYKLPIADVINGRLTAIPRGVFAAAAAMQGARGGVDVPESDRAGIIQHIERYYAKMDLDSPFSDEKQYFVVDDINNMDQRELEKALRTSGAFSKSAAKIIAASHKKEEPKDEGEQKALSEILEGLRATKKHL